MKSLSELAAIYERSSNANAATAKELLASLESLPNAVQEQQCSRAGQLIADAETLKIRAKELRSLEMVEIVEDGYKVPQDRDQPCDGPQAIRRCGRSG
jgi:hypothetical protein